MSEYLKALRLVSGVETLSRGVIALMSGEKGLKDDMRNCLRWTTRSGFLAVESSPSTLTFKRTPSSIRTFEVLISPILWSES
jgi:hypothetical protein